MSPPDKGGFLRFRWRLLGRQIDAFLDAERQQLPLWGVVAFGAGIASWFWLPHPSSWMTAMLLALGLSLGAAAAGGRLGRVLAVGALFFVLGQGHIWLRSEMVAAPKIERISIENFDARIERVEPLVARERVRLTLKPLTGDLPSRLRVSLREAQAFEGLREGATIRLRARLTPPPTMAIPGGYDFARHAWFQRIGGVGSALGDVKLLEPSAQSSLDGIRAALGAQVREALPGAGDGIATALTTGDKNAVAKDDAEAMRRSGLAHLLAVSGLHIAAVVGSAMLLSIKLLALWPAVARRHNLILWSAAAGALAGVGYTLLTGMQVPTVRACIAALLVLIGIALGRPALSLRLVAVGAMIILIIRPETIAGASFQLSFAAVTAIIAMHAHPRVRGWLKPRDDGWRGRMWRSFLALVLTGLAVEITLMPLALYHFHKAGLYGVLANLVAIPLTTFVVMPMLALALLFDLVGLGAPFWWAAGTALDLLVGLAHVTGNAKGAVAMVPTMPTWGFALAVFGGLWLYLWTHRVRWLGLVPITIGLVAAALSPRPDVLITGDGRHLAIVDEAGRPHLLRSRAGDFIRDILSENAGYDGDPGPLDDQAFANCNRDACMARLERGGRSWTILATRSRDYFAWDELIRACSVSDIIISDRRLPRACQARWLKLDRWALYESGGLALYLGDPPRIESVRDQLGAHPWAISSAE